MGLPRKTVSTGCAHDALYVDTSPAAASVGFSRQKESPRLAAATSDGRLTSSSSDELTTPQQAFNDPSIFPGPLVFPDDALALEPDDDDPQTFKVWLKHARSPGRQVTNRRKTLYVIPPPGESEDVRSFMKGWAVPRVPRAQKVPSLLSSPLVAPAVEDMCDYLRAFYHPMEVQVARPEFMWRSWAGDGLTPGSNTSTRARKAGNGQEAFLGLEPAGSGQLFGVRYRPSPDGIAKMQLNLCDIVDAMMAHIPADAFSIVMLTHLDLYEDDEDDFCCGRAWGSSRVAIVSSFRYHPSLDRYAGIDQEHMWPASHCKAYVDEQCLDVEPPGKRAKKLKTPQLPTIPGDEASPLALAVQRARTHMVAKTADQFAQLWMSRTARTISHEIGHCMVLDHCTFFACVMQGTASVAEDVRQPPYLCPVCLQKLSFLMGPLIGKPTTPDIQRRFIQGQHEALARLCQRWPNVGMFAGLAAWLEQRLGSMQGSDAVQPSVAAEGSAHREDATEDARASSHGRATRQTRSTALFAQWLDED